ncbi:LysR family transcriptional regulator [Streptomyces sp. NPDC058405]|uniref:LysR family transcriptional regulator n=1 Tax=unclassified Streptomyces TaxID=2593676 RepID=UPI00365D1045
MFEIDALRLLVTVAGTGSFTGAATRLNYTQSAVSRRIASLEQQAGGPLFERLPRGVRLNPAGHALHRHAVDVLERLARAEQELAVIHAGQGGTLRVGAFATANISLVPTALRAFKQARPEVEVIATEGRSGTLTQRLADGALDLAVVSDYPSGLPSADGVTTAFLLEDELLVALRREHPLAGAGTIDLWELRDEAWLQDAPAGGPTLLLDACARAGFRPKKLIRIAEWTGKFGYAAAGLGVALVPSLAAWAVPAELVLCRLGDLAPRRTVHIALPAAPLPAARGLRDLLRATVADGWSRELSAPDSP